MDKQDLVGQQSSGGALMFIAFFLAVADVPPASEAAIDAFIAALPPSKPKTDPGEAFSQDRLDQLLKRNPGREAEARAAFATEEQCERTAQEKAVVDAARSSARRLGDQELARLTSFYTGPDFAVFAKITSKAESELTKQDKSELKRLWESYPLEKYLVSVRETEQAMWESGGLMGALLDCHDAYEAELEKRGLE